MLLPPSISLSSFWPYIFLVLGCNLNLLLGVNAAVNTEFQLTHVLHNNIDLAKPKALGRLDVASLDPESLSALHNNYYLHAGAADSASDSAGILHNQANHQYDTTSGRASSGPSHLLTRELRLKPKRQQIWKLADSSPQAVATHVQIKRDRSRGIFSVLEAENPAWNDWIYHDTFVPDVTDKETVVSLATMAANAYVDLPFTGDWTNVSDPWSEKLGLGWMGDGLRGHVFSNSDQSIVVLSLKGTSAAIFDTGGDTVARDKFNDNMLFSCCCARISYLWNTVCDCYTGKSYTCDQVCLEDQLWHKDRYYRAVLDIYSNVTAMYPSAEIWVTGHSMGGSMSALLGRTYGLAVVAFEAPGEKLAASRLHLPTPPGIPIWSDHVWHFGHTADPVFMGVCNGPGSACWIGGYAMESACHTGLQCVYDVVTDLGWHVSMVNHRIHVVLDDVLSAYNETAKCRLPDDDCVDCYNWDFIVPGAPPHSSSTSSGSSTSATTVTATSTSVTTTTRDVPATKTKTKTLTPGPTKTHEPTCVRRNWFGRCVEWDDDWALF